MKSVADIYSLSKAMEKKICRGRDRYYMSFGCTPFAGGMSRAFTAGCNLRCVYCLSPFRDFPWGETRFILPEQYKQIKKESGFYSPEEVIRICVENEKSKKFDGIGLFDGVNPKNKKLKYLDVGYAEVTIGREHLLGLCEAASKTDYTFVLESNGFLLGYEEDYVEDLIKYKDNLLVRIGVKAATPEMWEKVAGVKNVGDYVYEGIRKLVAAGFDVNVAMMCDPRLYSSEEVSLMKQKIRDTGYKGEIHEEKIFNYFTAYKRFVEAGHDPYLVAVDGRLEITGKRVPGTFFLKRYPGEHLLLPNSEEKLELVTSAFLSMLHTFDAHFAKDLDLIIEFDIDDKKGGGSWHFIIKDCACCLERGMHPDANVRYVMDIETAFNWFVSGKFDFETAFYKGDFKIEGDPNLLYFVDGCLNIFKQVEQHCFNDTSESACS